MEAAPGAPSLPAWGFVRLCACIRHLRVEAASCATIRACASSHQLPQSFSMSMGRCWTRASSSSSQVRGEDLLDQVGDVFDFAQLARRHCKDEVVERLFVSGEGYAVGHQEREQSTETGALVPIDEWVGDYDPLKQRRRLFGERRIEF